MTPHMHAQLVMNDAQRQLSQSRGRREKKPTAETTPYINRMVPRENAAPPPGKWYCWKCQYTAPEKQTDKKLPKTSCPNCGRKTFLRLKSYSDSIAKVTEVLRFAGHKVDGSGQPENPKTYGSGRWSPSSLPGMRLLEAIQGLTRRAPADSVEIFQVPSNLTPRGDRPFTIPQGLAGEPLMRKVEWIRDSMATLSRREGCEELFTPKKRKTFPSLSKQVPWRPGLTFCL